MAFDGSRDDLLKRMDVASGLLPKHVDKKVINKTYDQKRILLFTYANV